MAKVSIITTTYNHQDFIWNTIQSILNQSINNRELLIGDDSPGNETWNSIQSYVNKYPDKIQARHNNPGKWIVDNMNFLINKISKETKYVAFLEGDDTWDNKYLEKKIDIFTEYPEVRLVYNNLSFIDRNNKVIQKDIFTFRSIKTYKNTKISPNEYIQAKVWPIISRSTTMIERSMLEKYKIQSLNPKNKTYSVADYDFFMQIAKDYPVYYISQELTLYRRHQTNLSWTNPKIMEEVWELILQYHKKDIISDKPFTNKMSHNKLIQAIIYLENGDKKKSLLHWKDALKYNHSNNIVMKIWIIVLLCLPLPRSKRILSKLIKRG